MSLRDELVEIIKLYWEYANNGDQILRGQYQQQTDPLSARQLGHLTKSGNIRTTDGILFYNFHGKGVHLEFPDNRIVDFDYEMTLSENGHYICLPSNFSIYSLHQFIESAGLSYSPLSNRNTCETVLTQMVANKLIIPLTYPNMVVPNRFYFR